mgnify:FL=1
MKKFSIITLIFVIPLVAYMILSKPDASYANKSVDGNKPQIIKFTSLMCLDCKKLDKVMKEIYPNYSGKITLKEVQVQNEDYYTTRQIHIYNVTIVQKIVFIDSKGKRVTKTEGFVEKVQLEKYMKELK